MESEDELGIGAELMSHVDGRWNEPHAHPRRIRRHQTSSSSSYGKSHRRKSDKVLYKRKGTYTEHLLEQLLWWLKFIFGFYTVVLVCILAATIVAAVFLGKPAANMLVGMSKNVDTMTSLGTGAPVQMAEVWRNVDGDGLVNQTRTIVNTTSRILGRIEADPNLNDQIFNVATGLMNKTDHLLQAVSEGDWVAIKTYGIAILASVSEWVQRISPQLVQDVLENSRDVSQEAKVLFKEAHDVHLVNTLNEAGHAASALGLRAAQLDEVTIKLPPVTRRIEQSPRLVPPVAERVDVVPQQRIAKQVNNKP